MDINKAIRKQKKSFIRFMLSMGFIFFALPIIVYANKVFSTFVIVYLFIIEILIILSIIIKVDRETLKFKYNGRLKISHGICGEKYTILRDRIEIVHTVDNDKNLQIIIILKSKIRNKNIKLVDSKFLKKYNLHDEYYKILKIKNIIDKDCYYIVLTKGGYYKYKLLNFIYKYFVRAYFTENAIKTVKEYRS